MAMSSYEVVRRAIRFEKPDRLPLNLPALGLNDFHSVSWNQIGTGDPGLHETLDEWGCTWMRSEVANMGQVKGHPLADWSALDHYRWPDADDPAFYEGMEERFEGSEGKYVSTSIFMLLFERMHSLHGFENTLLDLYVDRERIEMLADRIVEFDLGIIRNISERFPGRIHSFSFTDDWGTQQAAFIRTELWDEFFGPRYRRIFDAAHAAGWTVRMHTCGRVNELIDSLIGIGVDVLQLEQPRALDIKEIGRRFAGRVCFESLSDIQTTLPTGDHDKIREEARLLLEHWGTADGGFILVDYGDHGAIGAEEQVKQVMLDAFRDADPWKSS